MEQEIVKHKKHKKRKRRQLEEEDDELDEDDLDLIQENLKPKQRLIKQVQQKAPINTDDDFSDLDQP